MIRRFRSQIISAHLYVDEEKGKSWWVHDNGKVERSGFGALYADSNTNLIEDTPQPKSLPKNLAAAEPFVVYRKENFHDVYRDDLGNTLAVNRVEKCVYAIRPKPEEINNLSEEIGHISEFLNLD